MSVTPPPIDPATLARLARWKHRDGVRGSPVPSRPVLALRDLSVETTAQTTGRAPLREVSLDATAGEVLAVLGEAGAGLDTLRDALTDALSPPERIASGRIRLNGTAIEALSRGARRDLAGSAIAFMPNDPRAALDPIQTVGAQIIETIRAHARVTRRSARRRAREVLAQAGAGDTDTIFGARVDALTTAECRRAVLALALCARPRLLIADHVADGLHPAETARVIALLRGLSRESGLAIVLLTASPSVAARAADRICVLYAGRVAEIGPAAAVTAAPRHPFSRQLLGGDRSGDAATAPVTGAGAAGCPFHPGCPGAGPACRLAMPQPMQVGEAHLAACHFPVTAPGSP